MLLRLDRILRLYLEDYKKIGKLRKVIYYNCQVLPVAEMGTIIISYDNFIRLTNIW